MADITLSAPIRSNLLSLQNTSKLIGKTQNRLSTGLKVNSAIDDAASFFKAKSLNDRGADLSSLKDGIGQAISTVTNAVNALESVESTLQQMKGIASQAKGESTTTKRAALATQYNALRTRLNDLVSDASYAGNNLVKATPDTLTVSLNEAGSSTIAVAGKDSSSTSLSIANAGGTNWATTAAVDTDLTSLDAAISTVRDSAGTLASDLSFLNIRDDFTSTMINTLEEGAGKLVNADMNEEAANLLSLQTRQQLGTTALALASQSEQAVLGLF